MAEAKDSVKIDLKNGVPLSGLSNGKMLSGQADGEEVLLVSKGDKFFAVGAHCTHYGGALSEGLIVGETVRCPLHHACFSLRSGEALRAPAFDPIPTWKVERVGEKIFVREKLPTPDLRSASASTTSQEPPESVVIVGGGGAGLVAADMLRREGYKGPVTIISADDSPPCDRPNLSKDFLAGTAQEDWIPLRPPAYYKDQKINLMLSSRVTALDVKGKQVQLHDGTISKFGTLLIATGADPVHLTIEGAADSEVHYLRTFADSRALLRRLKPQSVLSSSEQALSDSRLRLLCDNAISRFMSWRQGVSHSNMCLGPSSGVSFETCTNLRALSFTSGRKLKESIEAASRLTMKQS